jgi:MFS superfamily sulfate permease-like transporter
MPPATLQKVAGSPVHFFYGKQGFCIIVAQQVPVYCACCVIATHMNNLFKHAAADLPAAIVVFLVALPLCLGVAVASDAAPVAGLIAGIVGGVVIGFFSGSPLSVSGPAAGLTAIVAGAIGKLPGYEVFLVAVVLAGFFQIILGFARAGIIGDFIPNAVIKGMLAAIGLILILKQFPHLLGYDSVLEGEEAFQQKNKENTFETIWRAIQHPNLGALIIGTVSLGVLAVFESTFVKKHRLLKLIPGALVVVLAGIGINLLLGLWAPSYQLRNNHLVQLEVYRQPLEFFGNLSFPAFAAAFEGPVLKQVIITAVTIALVASIETLLSIEAVDNIDPDRRITPTSRELKAQGIGNMVSGLLGGLPVTSVIVRSSANVAAGGKTKLSTIAHGVLLLLSVLFIPKLLNLIPLAALAGILIFTGYKLAKIKLFQAHFKAGLNQFIPFVVTILAILFTDLLIGIFIGLTVGVYFVLKSNFKKAILLTEDEDRYLVRFRRNVTFLNKAPLKRMLESIPDGVAVLVDASRAEFIDHDIIELINDFEINAETRGIRVYFKYSRFQDVPVFKDSQQRQIK